jgi:microcystin-dependent protein
LGGVENVALNGEEIAAHTHLVYADGDVGSNNTPSPSGNALATFATGGNIYATAAGIKTVATMNPEMIAVAGGGQPHPNVQPYLVVNFCIALNGIFPSRN